MSGKPQKPNWSEWLHIPQVKIWQACALSLDVEPHSVRFDRNAWMAGPGHAPITEDDSFPTPAIARDFNTRARILIANHTNRRFFSPCTIDDVNPGASGVMLSEFAAWAIREVKWSVPEELAGLAAQGTEAQGEDITEDPRFWAEFTEAFYNGERIDWRYWVRDMKTLTAAQATRLMSALEPDTFDDLETCALQENWPSPRHDPTRLCVKAKRIERLAENNSVSSGTPKEWLDWAESLGIGVHAGFRLAVDEYGKTRASAQSLQVERPQQKLQAQEDAILGALEQLGHDAMNLSGYGPGKPGPKAEILTELVPSRLFVSRKVFEHAWERLTTSQRIRYKPKK